MTSCFEVFGLKKVINASGKMTALGASSVSEEVAFALKEAAQGYVEMDELIKFAGTIIASRTGAEDGCPTASASAGIAIATAATITGTNLSLIERMPQSAGLKNEVIIQKGQLVHYGANIGQMIRLGGGKVMEVGAANKVEKEHIEDTITDQTAALFYVKSHHAVQKGMQPIDVMVDLAAKYHIPLIIDAAAEQDFQHYIKMGADIVVYSGAKALAGPTSGFLCGKRNWMAACRAQYKGIGRAMKVGKESVAGLIAALQQQTSHEKTLEEQREQMSVMCEALNKLTGLACSLHMDEAGRTICRAQIKVQEEAGITAAQLQEKLEKGNPAIYLRHHYANVGLLYVDPRPLLPGDEAIIVKEITKILQEGK
ncbi:DgaE family pyridoxal phosphate-dependent ammonia lyase [Bacillus chungangensis]|uniref:L-seryl-tRNA(Ser) seleniumtransferase/D-glucosaminate-6-phosphate ammonia-lyase n=1 Tax=Bacillus chungangensis TaxID=587633 RepID=A0ABT9WN39_9BACI|nr:DgaE family pyridoxal phosphate-dependent ammonia lyase [Bacillus chungangensis]MDQ0174686.1 L-seryl-tRNA(Ser) seleniumtransferase/D-glucosaminate-6-phosphate ammonia-lyase [Bacillus chungangensis]